MSYKRTGIDGRDYAFPNPCPVKPTILPYPTSPCMPPAYPPYPPVPAMPLPHVPGPAPTPIIPGYIPPTPLPPCPPPPYFPPKPSKTDEKLRKLQRDVERLKVVEKLITAFEQKNEPAILTIGAESYQFGTDRITNSEGTVVDGMYAEVICANNPVVPTSENFSDDSETLSVYAINPVDLLQTEKTRLALEINLLTQAMTEAENTSSNLSGEVTPN